MPFLRPKSFLVLVLIAFALVALPLNLALINAEFFMERLARRGSRAVYHSVAVIQESRNLVEQLLTLERRIRQYQVLKDDELLAGVREKHHDFAASVARLEELPLQPQQERLLTRLGEGERLLYDGLPPNGGALPEDRVLLARFDALNDLARGLYDESQQAIVREVDALQVSTVAARRRLLGVAVALLPVTLLVAGYFVALIARPIRQINRGINRLGEGDFTSPIRVTGPDDLRFLGQRLDWLRQRLDAVEREKSKFVSHVSHELKTPLASLREGTELLVEEQVGALNAQQREIVWILRRNGLQLQKLIDNLLGFSRMQAKISPFRGQPLALRELIEDVAADQRPAILKKDLALELSLAPVRLQGDRERLRNVVDNLLSNAVKYTPAGGRIAVSLTCSEHEALLQVSDSGPGIEPGEKDRIFKPFYQGSAPVIGPLQGTGIGLSIVQEYVRDHGGRIEVGDSALGGACFRVTLPLTLRESEA